MQYDNRMRLTHWDIPGVLGWDYNYSILADNSFRVSYAHNLYDGSFLQKLCTRDLSGGDSLSLLL
jgi:hypothetical protein